MFSSSFSISFRSSGMSAGFSGVFSGVSSSSAFPCEMLSSGTTNFTNLVELASNMFFSVVTLSVATAAMTVFHYTANRVAKASVVASDGATNFFVTEFAFGTVSNHTITFTDVTALGFVFSGTLFESVDSSASSAFLGDNFESILVIFLAFFLCEGNNICVSDWWSVMTFHAVALDTTEVCS
jgi:hypothetical protein